MDKLWAPWRIKYLRSVGRNKRCVFCRAKKSPSSAEVVFKSAYSIVMLNIYPYNNGHLMVSPLRHLSDISKLSDAEALDLLRSIEKSKRLLDRVLKPDGYNIGLNLGRRAGAGITAHMHVHIVPRWEGDTNFMPVLSGTRVISQSLRELAKYLKDAYARKD